MTPDELETERAALIAKIEAREPLSDDDRKRMAAVVAQDLARPRAPIEEAFAEVLAESVALSDRGYEPGLDWRVVGPNVEILSRGEVVATVSRAGLLERADEIEVARRRATIATGH